MIILHIDIDGTYCHYAVREASAASCSATCTASRFSASTAFASDASTFASETIMRASHQGLTLVHLSTQCKQFLWDMGCI